MARLLDAGATLDPQDLNGETPLHWAATRGHEAVVKRLLDAGAALHRRDQEGETALYWADMEGNEAVVECFLAAAAERGYTDLVSLFQRP